MRILNNESGRSMIEMLGVLLVMGVITVAAVQMISAAMRSHTRTATQDDITQITTGVRQLLGQFDDFSGIDNNTIFAALGMSSRNRFNGRYEIQTNPANPRQFIVSITGLNHSDCQYFRTRAWADSALFRSSNGRIGGATSTPANCADQSGNNRVSIIFGE